MRLFAGFCLLATLVAQSRCTSVDAATVQKVQDALDEALNNLASRSQGETTVTDDKAINLQKANGESKQRQFTGDLLQETTKVLVEKYGVEILPAANQLITEWMDESSDSSARKKRDYGAGPTQAPNAPAAGSCRAPPTNCNDIFHARYRATTGICNNLSKKTPGSAVTTMRTLNPAFYDDGLNSVRNKSAAGGFIPSTRLISNVLHQEAVPLYDPKMNHLFMQIGQYIAHDIIFMPSSTGTNGQSLDCSSCNSGSAISSNCAPIPAPANDPYFKPVNGIPRCIRLTRALNGQKGLGPRSQINQNTHLLDLSVVYGSSDCEATAVREFSNGLLGEYTGQGYVLPPQTNDTNCQSKAPYLCFTCGDFRNSLHPGLVPLHVAFIKEHNRIATNLRANDFHDQSDEGLFQTARKIMIGLWQHIVYTEYLPNLLGDDLMTQFGLKTGKPGSPPFKGYSANVDPSLTNEFAAAAFRFGHSQVRKDIPRVNNNNQSLGAALDLGNNIFYADAQYQGTQGGTEGMLQGMMSSAGMTVDRSFSFPIRNQLFEIRGQPASGVDLVAVNIMRGRDVGINPYYKYRATVGLPQLNSFDNLRGKMAQVNIDALKSVYADVRDIDLYPAILSELPVPGGLIGPTGAYIIAEQFRALKTGDRFYYENQVPGTSGFTPPQLDQIRKMSLSKFLCANAGSMASVNTNAFVTNSPRVPCTSIPDLDIRPWLDAI